MKLSVALLSIALSVPAYAADITDIYGVQGKEADSLVKKYSKRATALEVKFLDEGVLKKTPDPKVLDKLAREKRTLLNEIMQDGGFSYATVAMITYPGDSNHYVTIDVIKKNEPQRLRFASPMQKARQYPKQHDIIQQMQVVSNFQTGLILTNQTNSELSCPVYHCVASFDHPKVKPYLSLFNQGAVREKQLILNTLNHDPDPERRAAAAFLTGHFKDPHEIISVLLPHVNDPDEGVRNNVIRVIAMTMRNAHIHTIDAAPFIELLDSPSVTDRNKSLLVLLSAADSKEGKTLILQTGRDRLLALLQLKQPNNHEMAYRVIKKISGKSFGEYNISAWNHWWLNAQKKMGTKTA